MAYKRKIFHKDEHCLNCDAPIIGDYCGNCGQKAHLHKDSFWHMVVHFAGDYFHYDNKFWLTLKTLFTKPGQITLDYISGKRVKYLNPISLYIFVTTLYFIVSHSLKTGTGMISFKSHNNINHAISTNQLHDSLKNDLDIETNIGVTSTEEGTQIGIGSWTPKEKTLAEYDSLQKLLPANQQDGILKKFVRRKSLKANNDVNFIENYIHDFNSNFPKIFFLLLPFFGFLLKIIFYRKKLLFVDHLIFSIHFHSMGFLLLFIFSLCSFFLPISENNKDLLFFLFFIGFAIYLFLSLKKVYPSAWWKIALKQLTLFSLYLIGFIFSIVLIVVITFIIY